MYRLKASLLVLSTCGVALGIEYTWTANGTNDNWTTCQNWDIDFGFYSTCYAEGAGNDAVFPTGSGSWYAELNADRQIRDLDIRKTSEFAGLGATRTIQIVRTLTISAITASSDVHVNLDGAIIEVVASCTD